MTWQVPDRLLITTEYIDGADVSADERERRLLASSDRYFVDGGDALRVPSFVISTLDATSTACHRGYIATWLLHGDLLMLQDIKVDRAGDTRTIKEIFHNPYPPYIADWVTGQVRFIEVPGAGQYPYFSKTKQPLEFVRGHLVHPHHLQRKSNPPA